MYRVEVGNKATKRLKQLPTKHRRQVLEHIAALASNPRPPNSVKLRVLEGYRLSCGEYRVAYTVNDDERLVRVYLVFQRGEGYPES